jgi:hypothetical protein
MWEVNSADNAPSPLANTNTYTYKTRQQATSYSVGHDKVKADLTSSASEGTEYP